MKKNIKSLVSLGLALSMVIAGATSSFAGEKSFKMSGTIADADLTINVTVPTAGALTIKPYGKSQIATPAATFANGFATAAAAGAVCYDVSLAGYTVTATSATADALITLTAAATATGAYTGTKKEASISIQVGAAAAGDTIDTSDAVAFEALFASPVIDVVAAKKSEADYDATSSTSVYTALKETTPTVVTLKPGDKAPFRIYGTMNPNAPWEAGDAINVTPVFKIVPNVTAALS